MKPRTRVIVASVAGVAVAGGLVYGLYKLFSNPSPTASSSGAAAPSACERAAQLAQLATTVSDRSPELGPYQYWANLCRQQGGTPAPFPS